MTMEFKCSECGQTDEVTTCAECKKNLIWEALLDCVMGGMMQSSLSREEILEATLDTDAFDKKLVAIL